jgi:hypothetical protein
MTYEIIVERIQGVEVADYGEVAVTFEIQDAPPITLRMTPANVQELLKTLPEAVAQSSAEGSTWPF